MINTTANGTCGTTARSGITGSATGGWLPLLKEPRLVVRRVSRAHVWDLFGYGVPRVTGHPKLHTCGHATWRSSGPGVGAVRGAVLGLGHRRD